MKNIYLLYITLMTLITVSYATTSHATNISYGGSTYKIDIIQGSYINNLERITSTPWWMEDESIAAHFALEYMNNINPVDEPFSPLFGYIRDNDDYSHDAIKYKYGIYNSHDGSITVYDDERDVDSPVEWAVNTPVPEPATMLLFGIGLLGLAGVNRRKQ